jgi:hypothetical protein
MTTISNCPYCDGMVTVVVGKLISVGHSPLSDKCPYRGPAGVDQEDAIRKHNDNCRIYNNIKKMQLIESQEMIAVKRDLSKALADVDNLIGSGEYPTVRIWKKWLAHARGVKEGELCPQCSGLGWKMYEDTSTWRRGWKMREDDDSKIEHIKTFDVCDQCWGSGVTTLTGEIISGLYALIGELEEKLRVYTPKAYTFDEIKRTIELHQKMSSQGVPE